MSQIKRIFFTVTMVALAAMLGSFSPAKPETECIISSRDLKGGNLEQILPKYYKGSLTSLKTLVIREGRLDSDDARFIRTKLIALEELIMENNADFVNSTVPKNGFEGHKSLKKVRIDNARVIGSKAFSMCEALESVEFGKVEEVGVQAFSQAKGSSNGQLRTVRLPSLKLMEPRTFYYCTNLKDLYLTTPPSAIRPEGKEGLWFERVTNVVIHVPSADVYNKFIDAENCVNIDWSAYSFIAENGDNLPEIKFAKEYDDTEYDYLRNSLLPTFDRTDKDYSGEYYTGDFKVSLNMYTFNSNINAWMNNSSGMPQLSTIDAIKWAAEAGFDAVDVTCYYIPGYSNTTMPTKPEKEIMDYARKIKNTCKELGLEISGTGIQNNFADPNEARRLTDVERIKFWINVAAEMGAPVIRIFPGPPPADIRREGWEKIARERIVPHIQEVADYAKANYPQVRIGVQNHGCMIATANQVIQLLKWIDRDNVGIINDTGFYRDFLSTDATKYDWYRDIALVLPYSNNFQIKKKPAGAETSILMDLDRLMYEIRKSPYRGYIPVELLWVNKDAGAPGKLDTPPYEETREFVARLKKAMEDSKKANEVSDIVLSDNTTLNAFRKSCPEGEDVRAYSADGLPRVECENICEGDKLIIGDMEYRVRIEREELVNLALGSTIDKIKVSSYDSKCDVTAAFDGASTGTSGSGFVVDKSQATSKGKQTFWLAVDLGKTEEVNSIGIGWGTSIGKLKTLLKDGTYKLYCTDDSRKWDSLSGAKEGGKSGFDTYSAPKGWTEVYSQDVNLLPDANGNKVFIHSFDKPLTGRYFMVCGELTSKSIEIYEFMIFRQEKVSGAAERPKYGTYNPIDIIPDKKNLALMPGRPAIVAVGSTTPDWHLRANENLEASLYIVNPKGETVYKGKTIPLKKSETFVISPSFVAETTGTYRAYFTISTPDGTFYHDTYSFTAINGDTTQYSIEKPYPAFIDKAGKLEYIPDYKGNTLLDYSYAGYKNGGVALPNVPVKIILEPSNDPNADDSQRIQKAINLIGRSNPDKNGFRGALLLKAGTFYISRPIEIHNSGVVVKGEGDDYGSIKTFTEPLSPTNWFDYTQSTRPEKGITKVVATWKSDSYDKNTALFDISGGSAQETDIRTDILDCYVPVGSKIINVRDASAFKAGDVIRLVRNVGAAWAQTLKMDVITDAPGIYSANQWVDNGNLNSAYCNIAQERRIASIEGNRIILEEPVADPLDMKYGVCPIVKINKDRTVRNSGVENIQLISLFDPSSTVETRAFEVDYKFYDDEYHAQVGVRFGNAEDVWVRRVTSYHIDVAVNVSGGCSRVTVQDVNCLEPVSGVGGERRYSFTNSGGSFVLNQRCYTRFTRHGFIIMGHVMGPNVFYNDCSEWQFDANEPHLRWSAGGLFDNVKGRIYVQNRWNNGTAHGWSGANYVLYNCEGKFISSQNHLAANYVFGQSSEDDRMPYIMDAVDPGKVPNFQSYEYSIGKKMPVKSLYLRQLEDRLGKKAVAIVNDSSIPSYINDSKGFVDSFAYIDELKADGKPIVGFDRAMLEYTVPVALDYKSLPKLDAKAAKGVKIDRTDSRDRVIFTVSAPGKTSSTYIVKYEFVSKEPVSSSTGGGKLSNILDGSTKTSWSVPGTPYVQFYLGESPVEIKSISFGYCRNTQSRRQYYFDFEVSDDGYEWKKIECAQWQKDNLGNGHIMGLLLQPGKGNSKDDYETFEFPKGVKARLVRIRMFGARNGQGSSSANANSYWAIDLETK